MDNNSFAYNGFTYTKQDIGKNSGVDVFHNIPKPEKVFKYYSLNKYNVDALTEGYFYASHPFELNDYLDSSPFLLISSIKQPLFKYRNLFQGLISEKELEDYYESDFTGKMFIKLFWDLISNIFGVISLTSNEHCPLMWPHYTREKGFQIAFNSKNLEESLVENIDDGECFGLMPINYTNQLQPIDLSAYDDYHIPFFYATNIKTKLWKYENEWRFLIGKKMMGVPYSKLSFTPISDYLTPPENRYTYYDKNIVEQITLGVNFFTTFDFEIEWLDDRNIQIKPIKGEGFSNFDAYAKLLAYICDNLNDCLFQSSTKYEDNEDNTLRIIRTKERLEIKRIKWNTYILTRTDEVINFF